MQGRDLTRGLGNAIDLDVFIRDNKHYYDVFIYGFQQEKDLNAEIHNALKSTIIMKLLFYISMQEIYNSLKIDDLKTSMAKYIDVNTYQSIKSNASFSMEKNINIGSYNSIKTKVLLLIDKYISAHEIKMSFILGTINAGELIHKIESLTVADIDSLTIDDIIKGDKNMNGLRLGLVKLSKVIDIQDLFIYQIQDMTLEKLYLFIYQIQDMTLEKLCYARIH